MNKMKIGRCIIALVLALVLLLAPVVPQIMAFNPQNNENFPKGIDENYIRKEAPAVIEPEVIDTLKKNESVEVMVLLKEKANLNAAKTKAVKFLPMNTSKARIQLAERVAVVSSLSATAVRTQGSLMEFLEKEKKSGGKIGRVKSYYIVNTILVEADQEIIKKLARRPEVESITLNKKIELIRPELEEESQFSVKSDNASYDLNLIPPWYAGVEWNVDHIGANEVWNRYDLDGEGIVVGVIDTGIDWEHEALKEKWRGYNPETPETPDLEYNWFDAVNGQEMPYDELEIPHGSHVVGTILGQDQDGENKIGVAPGAKWIVAKAFNGWHGTNEWLLDAGQYMLAPWGEDGVPNPAKAPRIINNSWGGGTDEWYREMVQTWREANILPVFAAGNESHGYTPETIDTPGSYPESFAVAATDINNKKAWFSSEGPGIPYYEDVMKPEISAPGVNIRSSVPGGYESGWSGTSMAAPHIAGVAALLLSANSDLTVDELEQIMEETATPLTDSYYRDVPNYGYGHGLINALSAVAKVVDEDAGVIQGRIYTKKADVEAPEIFHEPVIKAYKNIDMKITARITDDVAVSHALLQFMAGTDDQWDEAESDELLMELIHGDDSDGIYLAYIPAEFVNLPGLQYRILVEDIAERITFTEPVTIKDDGLLDHVKPGITWDLEEYPDGWNWDGDWEWGEIVYPKGLEPVSGSNVFGTNLSKNYSNHSSSYLVSPPLNLSGYPRGYPLLFKFHHWYMMEYGYDNGNLMIKTGSDDWQILDNFTGSVYGNDDYDYWKMRLEDEDEDEWDDSDWGDDDWDDNDWEEIDEYEYEWLPYTLDLQHYAGTDEPVFIGFWFESDSTIVDPGWYIDDISFIDVNDEEPEALFALSTQTKPYGINLRWAPSNHPGLSEYRVYRSENSGGPYELMDAVVNNQYVDDSVASETTYYYVVTVVAGNFESEYSEETEALSPDLTDLVYWTNFEDNNGGFNPGGTIGDKGGHDWEWGIPMSSPWSAAAGLKLWGTNLRGNYRNNGDYWLETPAIELPNEDGINLSFANWYSIHSTDEARICISVQEENKWLEWDELKTYDGYVEWWQQEIISLDEFAGKEIKLRFCLLSDDKITMPGWYIDDLVIALNIAEEGYAVGSVNNDTSVKKATVSGEGQKTTQETVYVRTQSILSEFSKETIMVDYPIEAWVTVNDTWRSVVSDPLSGFFKMIHPLSKYEGEWLIRVDAYGYESQVYNYYLTKDGIELEIEMEPKRSASVRGTVVDSDNRKPVAGAEITVTDYYQFHTASVDENGEFMVETIFEGYYAAWISAPNYQTKEIELALGGDDINTDLGQIELDSLFGHYDLIAYDEDSPHFYEASLYYQSGFALRMTPHTTARLKKIGAYIGGADWPVPGGNSSGFAVYDSGPDGEPGELVVGPLTTTVNRGGWNYVDISGYNFTTSRDFYAVWFAPEGYPNSPAIGFSYNDSEPEPESESESDLDFDLYNRTYSYEFGEISPYAIWGENAMIRCLVDYDLEVTFDLDNLRYVSQEIINLTGKVSKDGLVNITLNQEFLETVEPVEGFFEINNVELEEGENHFSAVLITETGESPLAEITVIRDTVAPVLSLNYPASGLEVDVGSLIFRGRIDDDNPGLLIINGVEHEPSEDGSFIIRKELLEIGENVFEITVTDRAGNISEGTVININRILNSNKAFLTYSIPGQVEKARIDYDTQTVTAIAKAGTDLTDIKATFTLVPEAIASVNGTIQNSGITTNDFSEPLVYTLIAEDETETEWMVTVTKEIYGDANGDGSVTVQDAILMLQHLVALKDISELYGEEALTRVKVNNGETLTVYDVILVLQYTVGGINGFPIQEINQH